MPAVTDLQTLLRAMEPVLWPEPWSIIAIGPGQAMPAGLEPFALIREAEGITLIAPAGPVGAHGLDAGAPWARISLTAHSDLAAVGLTAAMSRALADHGISANVVAGYYHDHVFVPWDRRGAALTALQSLAGGE